ncbi:TIGR04211 family SH3 domain-containing protein [Bacterioplanoides pacificum]|uniref:TIGR04211 family SH3 domain-containing protein n=1 Tax=Bacterioplanoides pacificum TaxID=1171596 RepID=A0ABV7VRD3_9GAMM
MKNILLFIATLMFSLGAAAVEKRYVADTLWLQLRSGPSSEYRILKALQSGEHLIFIEEDEATGYTRVKTTKGLEGWVLTRFLLNEPIAKEKLILANREMDKLKAELSTLKSQKEELSAQVENLKSDRSGLSRSQDKLEKELKRITTISSNALALDEKSKKLTQRNQELEIQVEALTAENAQLRDDRQQTYLIYGGGLVIIGIFAGLVLPSLRGGKRSGGWA